MKSRRGREPSPMHATNAPPMQRQCRGTRLTPLGAAVDYRGGRARSHPCWYPFAGSWFCCSHAPPPLSRLPLSLRLYPLAPVDLPTPGVTDTVLDTVMELLSVVLVMDTVAVVPVVDVDVDELNVVLRQSTL